MVTIEDLCGRIDKLEEYFTSLSREFNHIKKYLDDRVTHMENWLKGMNGEWMQNPSKNINNNLNENRSSGKSLSSNKAGTSQRKNGNGNGNVSRKRKNLRSNGSDPTLSTEHSGSISDGNGSHHHPTGEQTAKKVGSFTPGRCTLGCGKITRRVCEVCQRRFCKDHRIDTISCLDYSEILRYCYSEEKGVIQWVNTKEKIGRCVTCTGGRARKAARAQCRTCGRFVCLDHRKASFRCPEHKYTSLKRNAGCNELDVGKNTQPIVHQGSDHAGSSKDYNSFVPTTSDGQLVPVQCAPGSHSEKLGGPPPSQPPVGEPVDKIGSGTSPGISISDDLQTNNNKPHDPIGLTRMPDLPFYQSFALDSSEDSSDEEDEADNIFDLNFPVSQL